MHLRCRSQAPYPSNPKNGKPCITIVHSSAFETGLTIRASETGGQLVQSLLSAMIELVVFLVTLFLFLYLYLERKPARFPPGPPR
jgi:hypothetical protein